MSQALAAAVADLWPVPAGVEPPAQEGAQAGGRAGAQSGAGRGASYCVVPAAGGVGMALPLTPRRAAARAVCQFSGHSGPGDIARRLALAASLGLGLGHVLPGRISVAGDAASLAARLGEVFAEPVVFSVAIGPLRANRKAVLQIFNRKGRTLGFAKVGGTAVSDADVAAEAAALRALMAHPVERIQVPELIWSGTWRGAQVVVMGAVPQRAIWRSADGRESPLEELAGFLEAHATGSARVVGSRWWTHVEERIDGVRDDAFRQRAQRCLARSAEVLSDLEVPFSAWHGDWTPWNMARHRGGLSVWDWERFDAHVPAGLDILHHGLSTRLSGSVRPEAVLEALAATTPDWRRLGTRVSAEAEGAAGMYLAEISARYLPLLSTDNGAVLRDRSTALLVAWERWCVTSPVSRSR